MTSPAPTSSSRIRKSLTQMLIGGIAGGAVMLGLLAALEPQQGLLEDSGRMAALATALLYALMALFVGIGTLVPGVGARTLNVADAEEIAEQRQALIVGSLSFLLVAVLLAALGLAHTPASSGPLPTGVATILAGGASAGLLLLAVRYRHLGDELMRLASKEASSIMVVLLLVVIGGKSAAAQLGFTPPLAPLHFLAAFFALYLLAVFIAVGKRGLLTPK